VWRDYSVGQTMRQSKECNEEIAGNQTLVFEVVIITRAITLAQIYGCWDVTL